MPQKTYTLEDARNLLFQAAEDLRDAKPDDLDAQLLKAKGIGSLVGIVIESAKVEVQFLRLPGQEGGTSFLGPSPGRKALPAKAGE